MDERGIIDNIFKPLAGEGAPAFGLENDTAIYSPPEGCDLVITKDVMIEGVHFPEGEAPGVIAQRLLRSNLSDLAAAGAKPVGYLLGLMAKETIGESWLKAFAAALKQDQEEFGIRLMGGDTTSVSNSLCWSLTAIGAVEAGRGLTRQGASKGDLICVSGTIGDAGLGLKCLTGKIERDEFLIGRFQKPEPRLALGQGLTGIASAVIDISDGLALDLENLCRASGVGAKVHLERAPLSGPAKKYAAGDQQKLIELLTAGDDFELLFAVPVEKADQIPKLAKTAGLPIPVLGEITGGGECQFLDVKGRAIAFRKKGYRHFSERG